jgi:hypothetical protein
MLNALITATLQAHKLKQINDFGLLTLNINNMKKRIAIIDDTHNGVIKLKLENDVLKIWDVALIQTAHKDETFKGIAKQDCLNQARAEAFIVACKLTVDNIPVFCFEQKF